ncbi:MAG TPA: hypothetical protein VG458_01010 [Solirubrobacterales bacterium]|nr:hypothetical protein [Solirubrobacterales bacterium]
MSHKSWTFTAYENGKPAGTEHNLDSRQALAAIRAAMVGEPVLTAVESTEQVAQPVELARAA